MHKIVAVTLNPKTAADLRRITAHRFEVRLAQDREGAMHILRGTQQISAIVVEQTTGIGDALYLLECARDQRPEVRRVLMSGYTELAPIIRGLHSGAVERVVQLPINPAELLVAIAPAQTVGGESAAYAPVAPAV